MREEPNLARTWTSYALGILVESGYVVAVLGVAAVICWVVLPR
ncbi:MAG: hypothetical protein ACM3RP_10930 [Chitinophagales bacterium]